MTDLSKTIAPKSDQLNADDLIAGPVTIKITRVAASPNTADQPISIYFEGDDGKPYKPCKSMRRVLVHVWGSNGNAYAGRHMTLYRDPAVVFGGIQVGGIRISHMSDIDQAVTMALTATRASRKPYTVKPLVRKHTQTADNAGGPIEYAGERYDPAQPRRVIPPISIDDMDGSDLNRHATKLAEIVKAAPAESKRTWLEHNADDLARIKSRKPALEARLQELASPPPASGADGDAPSRDGALTGGEGASPNFSPGAFDVADAAIDDLAAGVKEGADKFREARLARLRQGIG
ncbi:MAG TPA: hypothetical protein PKY87_02225 [Terricaulis sp.]|nr:hypothetical protein [Terricaulis sp.]